MSEALLNLYLRREPGGYKYDEDRTVCRREISGSSRTLGCTFCLVGNPHLIPNRARRVINTCSEIFPRGVFVTRVGIFCSKSIAMKFC